MEDVEIIINLTVKSINKITGACNFRSYSVLEDEYLHFDDREGSIKYHIDKMLHQVKGECK